MREDRALDIARICAYSAGTDSPDAPSYLPRTTAAGVQFVPHQWVLNAILRAAAETERGRPAEHPEPMTREWCAAEIKRLRDLADSEGTRAVDYLRRARKAEAALSELVALKELQERLLSLNERGHGTDYEHFHRRNKPSWDEARVVLAALKPNV